MPGSRRPRRAGLALVAVAAFAVVGTWTDFSHAAADSAIVGQQLRQRCVEVLRRALNEEQGSTRALAAEYLLRLDYWDGVQDLFERELKRAGNQPEDRIRIWHVLALAPVGEKQRDAWIARIRDVFLDTGAPDRLLAIRSLAELGYHVDEEAQAAFAQAAYGSDDAMAAYASWVLTSSGEEGAEDRLAELLALATPQTRAAAATALLHLPQISEATVSELSRSVRLEQLLGLGGAVSAIGAMAVHAPDERKAPYWYLLRQYAEGDSPPERRAACEALAIGGTREHLPILVPLLDDPHSDVRIAAAWAILRIGRRVPPRMPALDWAIIALYATGMLAVGWYYARRTVSTEDYLLGGRNMNWLNVGLSLFATLLSTISYLAWPGEMIRYGPLFMIGAISAYPFIFVVTGWFLIPFIMKLRVTSAYEILESQLGTAVRVVGSFLFLALRLAWMAVIIFATSDKVLVPLMGWSSSATPYVCVVLGAITVIYTSMGGLRAVVLTDVVQTLILFGGAILTLVLVTLYLGGVGQWWPAGWLPHWPEPVWGYQPGVRVTFFGGFLATFTWYVCTSGSDQMAIQRYLATRDVRAARFVLGTSLVASTLVTLIMISVGLAIFAYFRVNAHLIPDGKTMLSDADAVFPRFICIGIPMGLSGLVVAGLLAAAMSSLSSGVNSAGSVITVDFIDRFRRPREGQDETDHVKLARYVSVLVGVAVVLLSLGVRVVEGNLLELAMKVVNLLTAPLFGLFFMAMFVRWATGPGTLVGAFFGLAVAVVISFWKDFTGNVGIGFLWAMPLSLVVQIGVGMLVSLVPIGRRAQPAA